MTAGELIKQARERADYDGSIITALQQGLSDTWDNVRRDLDDWDQDMVDQLTVVLRNIIEKRGSAARMAITIIAFEIQIENAQQRQSERSN